MTSINSPKNGEIKMPQLIDHIDAIARKKGRGVLFVVFDSFDIGQYEDFPERKKLIKWLEDNHIDYCKCAPIASENGFESYNGQLYLDVCYDENDPVYIKLRDYLENPDGSPRIPGIAFWYLPLEVAMQNKHHDEPGFWEKWAKDF